VPEPGIDAAVQLHGDAPPPVSPADQKSSESGERRPIERGSGGRGAPGRRRGLLARMRRRRHEELFHGRGLRKAARRSSVSV
jgi:hypothetical protein